MRIDRYLLILAAFLIMISSTISLFAPQNSRTAVYVNVGAMAALAVAVGVINFKNTPRNNM